MCTFPNYIAYSDRISYKTGKHKIDFFGHHQLEFMKKFFGDRYIEVPCGKCLECRIQYTRAWADRLVLEARNSPFNYFVTLTYDDENVGNNCLSVRDIQLFMKRLRKKFPHVKIKYFACGEYAPKNIRKHYHLCLFNLPLTDLTFEFQKIDPITKKPVVKYLEGLNYQFSETIFDAWDHQGYISVAPFSYNTAAYVAQYCLKKVDGSLKDRYKEIGLTPEFITMSKGLSFSQYDDDIVLLDHMIVERSGSCVHSHNPRYFDKLFIKKYGDEVFDRVIRKNRNRQRDINRKQKKYLIKDQQNLIREHRYKINNIRQRELKEF